MKVALLISGYLRTFKNNLPKIQKSIIDNFDDVDVYIHVTKNEKNNDTYLNLTSLTDDIKYINDELKPLSLICEDNILFSDDKKINNTYNNWFKFYKLNELKKINENENKLKYDLVIKFRPDLNIISDNIFNFSENTITIPKESLIDKKKLITPNDKYICDILAYGSSSLMDDYFSIFNNLESLINDYGYVSETILYHHLTNNKINYELTNIKYNVILSSCNVFAICGDSGSGKTTLGNVLKQYFSNSFMLECDRYHKWERNDENWKSYTHLNPESNFLSKMSQDVFDLKIGKSVYHVDYDHNTGKFTDTETIDSSDNLIVCGLHSLYNDNNHLYNLKIFVDTSDNLKLKWKIQRDVNERGYTLEKVLKQIKDRQDDYLKYIYPQKDLSDLIVNFYLNNEDEISLKLHIKINYDISNITKEFNSNNINFTINKTENFNIFDFKNFTPINNLSDKNYPKLNNFYDYIMRVIINLNN
jgi:uridine kinase